MIRNAAEIQAKITISRATIYYNLAKLQKTGSMTYQNQSGRPKKITWYIRRNPAISSQKLAGKMSINVSYSTIQTPLGGISKQTIN